MEHTSVGDVDKGTPGTARKSRGSRIRRSLAAVAMGGALALGIFGAAHSGQSHVSQSAGSTWSATVPGPRPMGSTWS